jgi:hypothetical protein
MRWSLKSPDGSPGDGASTGSFNRVSSTRTTGRRIGWGVAGGLALLVILSLFALRHRIGASAEAMILERLAQRGLKIEYRSRQWLPWRGLTFRDVRLSRAADTGPPLIEASNLSAEVSWSEAWSRRALHSRWHTSKARLTLHDKNGPLTLDNVTAVVDATPQSLEVKRLRLHQGAVTADLDGRILMKERTDTRAADESASMPEPFRLPAVDLTPLRAALAQLDIAGQADSLVLDGTGLIDLRATPRRWSVSLDATGGGFRWRGVPVKKVLGSLSADQEGWKGENSTTLPRGTIQTRLDQKVGQPLTFSGTARDPSSQASSFRGAWNPRGRKLELHQVSGKADWIAITRDVPAVAKAMPASLAVEKFPALDVRDLTIGQDGQGRRVWSVRSVQLTSPATVSITMRGHPLTLSGLTGRASFDDRRWNLQQVRAATLGGTLRLDGQWAKGVLSRASITGESLQLAAMTPWLGQGSQRLDGARAQFEYRGKVGTESRQATGRGSLRLDDAPLVEIPLLDQTYTFFAAAVPGGPPPGPGRMTAAFEIENGVMRVSAFDAQSQSVVVTGYGTIDFPRRMVEARARGELRGVAGWATQPISRALEMNISGPLAEPRVTARNPAGIAGGLIQGTAESAVDALQLPGKVLERAATFPQRLWRALQPDERPAP